MGSDLTNWPTSHFDTSLNGLSSELAAAAEREFARWRREDEAANRIGTSDPGNVIYGVDFNAGHRIQRNRDL